MRATSGIGGLSGCDALHTAARTPRDSVTRGHPRSWADALHLLLAERAQVTDEVMQGVGVVSIPSTGEVVGQYGYEIVHDRQVVLPLSLQVDVPVGVAVRCKAAGLTLELELEDGRRVVFVVGDVGPGGADVDVVGIRT
jgi:hypothetical protein